MSRRTYIFANRVYPPVGGATGELLKELAEGLVAGGARVVVVTSRGGEGTKGQEAGGGEHGAGGGEQREGTGDGRQEEGVAVFRSGGVSDETRHQKEWPQRGARDAKEEKRGWGTGDREREAGGSGQEAGGGEQREGTGDGRQEEGVAVFRSGGVSDETRHEKKWPQRGARDAKEEKRGRGTGDREREAGPVEYASHSTGQEDLRLTDLKLKTPTGVEVIRVGTATFTRASHWRRALSYLTLYPQLMWQVWKLGKVEAVVSMTDPPLQVAAVTLASWRARKKIHWAQDVYPELAEELGVIGRGGIVARMLRAVSTWALRRQDKIVVVGRCMRKRLIARGIDAGKIEVIPNWSPVAAVPADEAAAMRRKLGWGEDLVALYSGNIGLAHDFETLVGAAKLLEGTEVRMVFTGEGPRLEEVRRATAGLSHVSFLPPQPKEELGAFLAAADVHLVTVRAGLEGLVVPSKAYGILAAGRPAMYVGSAESEIAKLLTESGAGLVFRNGEARGLAEALKSAAAASDTFQRIGAAAMRSAGGWTFVKALAKWREVLAEE